MTTKVTPTNLVEELDHDLELAADVLDHRRLHRQRLHRDRNQLVRHRAVDPRHRPARVFVRGCAGTIAGAVAVPMAILRWWRLGGHR